MSSRAWHDILVHGGLDSTGARPSEYFIATSPLLALPLLSLIHSHRRLLVKFPRRPRNHGNGMFGVNISASARPRRIYQVAQELRGTLGHNVDMGITPLQTSQPIPYPQVRHFPPAPEPTKQDSTLICPNAIQQTPPQTPLNTIDYLQRQISNSSAHRR